MLRKTLLPAVIVFQSLLIGAFDPGASQVLFSSQRVSSQTNLILDDDFDSWLKEMGYKWGMKGVSIAVTRRMKDEHGMWTPGWATEYKGYGVADRWDTPVTENVCLFVLIYYASFFNTRVFRRYFLLGPILNYSLHWASVFWQKIKAIQYNGIPK